MAKKLYRSRSNKMISGVCAGIANYFDIDPTIIRLLAVILLFAGHIAALVAYFVCIIVIPESPYDYTTSDHVDYEDSDQKKN